MWSEFWPENELESANTLFEFFTWNVKYQIVKSFLFSVWKDRWWIKEPTDSYAGTYNTVMPLAGEQSGL